MKSDSYPKQLAGASQPLTFTAGATGYVECVATTVHGELTEASDELGLSAENAERTATVTKSPTVVAMNSCRYELGVLDVGPPYASSLRVGCEKGSDKIEYKVYSGKHLKTLICNVRVGAQEGQEGVALSNVLLEGEPGETAIGIDSESPAGAPRQNQRLHG